MTDGEGPVATGPSLSGATTWGHPDATVHPDDLGVHIGVGEQLDHHRRQLIGFAEPVREQHRLAELGLEGLRCLALPVDRGVDQTGATVFTRIPTADRSRATGRVIPTTPPLDDE